MENYTDIFLWRNNIVCAVEYRKKKKKKKKTKDRRQYYLHVITPTIIIILQTPYYCIIFCTVLGRVTVTIIISRVYKKQMLNHWECYIILLFFFSLRFCFFFLSVYVVHNPGTHTRIEIAYRKRKKNNNKEIKILFDINVSNFKRTTFETLFNVRVRWRAKTLIIHESFITGQFQINAYNNNNNIINRYRQYLFSPIKHNCTNYFDGVVYRRVTSRGCPIIALTLLVNV